MDTGIINVVAAGASAVAAVCSVVVAVLLGRRTASIAAAQHRHSSFSTAREWRCDVRNWASEAIEVLSEATYMCSDTESVGGKDIGSVLSCRYRLSSLIDSGRFFFPNIRRDEHGTDKPFAYRGFRHAVLDPLVAAERVLGGGHTGRFRNRKEAVVAMKREFVSSIQRIIDPKGENEEIARMVRETQDGSVDDPTLGGLLPDRTTIPPGADGILSR